MKKSALIWSGAVFAGAIVPFFAMAASADEGPRLRTVQRFATLPAGHVQPEGLAADSEGNIYTASPQGIDVFGADGLFQFTIPLPTPRPLGLRFDQAGELFVADLVGGNVLKFTPPFSSASTPAETFSVCGGVGAGCFLNAITFDASGNAFITDSLGGQIFEIALPAGTISTFFADERLKPPRSPHGFPHIGANGLVFDAAGTALYVANTADGRNLKLDLATMTLDYFGDTIHGPDDIMFDSAGLLWVAANQGDQVVALDSKGKIVWVARGLVPTRIGPDGAPRFGLLFPASLAISRGFMYVTNLARPITPEKGDELEEDVTTYTVSRFRLP